MKVEQEEYIIEGFIPEDYDTETGHPIGGANDVTQHYRVKTPRVGLPRRIAIKKKQIRRLGCEVMQEVQMLKRCSHPNILKLFYWKLLRFDVTIKFIYFYTELCDKNLRTFCSENTLAATDIKILTLQILKGCQYLHDLDVVHRNIKPENILVLEKGSPEKAILKLADFGLARLMPSEDHMSSSFHFTACGLDGYASPEVVEAVLARQPVSSTRPQATDIFSLGVVIFEMITKKLPFKSGREFEELEQEGFIEVDVPHQANACEALCKMLQKDPSKRPPARDILQYFKDWIIVIKAGDYVVGKIIGQGSFGTVNECLRASTTATTMPEKIVRKRIAMMNLQGNEKREYETLKVCDHPNIVSFFYADVKETCKDQGKLYLYMEFCDQNLKTFLAGQAVALTAKVVHGLGVQLLQAISYLHDSIHVAHRDIKPENILINNGKNPVLKLGDFGLSRFVSVETRSMTKQCGSKYYAAPEMQHDGQIPAEERFLFPADIFSVGVVLFEIMTKKRPFTLLELSEARVSTDKIKEVVKKEVSHKEYHYCLPDALQWDTNLRSAGKTLLANWRNVSRALYPEDYSYKKTLNNTPEVEVMIYCRNKLSSNTNFPVQIAVKKVFLNWSKENESKTKEELRKFKTKFEELRRCSGHENVLQLYFADIVNNQLCLYSELCEQNLRTFMTGKNLEGPDDIRMKLCCQLLQGCSYLHLKISVAHQNIKPENILVRNNEPHGIPVLKLADFGLASLMFSKSHLGLYSSPELTRGERDVISAHFLATDIFSLGVVIYEMFCMKRPFTIKELSRKSSGASDMKKLNKIQDPVLHPVLKAMLQWDPRERPKVSDLISKLADNGPKENQEEKRNISSAARKRKRGNDTAL